MSHKTRVIAFINQKGGCGKTTCCASVAKGLEFLFNKKVLAIDLDIQRNLSAYYGVYEPVNTKKTIYDLIKSKDKIQIEDFIIHQLGIDIITSSSSLVNFELEFGNKIGRESLLKKKLTPFISYWDYICIDTPPSLSLLTLQALTTSNELFIVSQPKYFDLLGLSELLNTVQEVKDNDINADLSITGIIINMFDSRLKHHNEIISMVKEDSELKDNLFQTYIRNNISLSEASSFGQPIFLYAPHSNGAKDFTELCKEIINQE